mmetsp:Transcript_23607/g.89660  ORF Transcript_23607/g.89660 Transcript_23607/m.89660 type:complete len:169 (-) Transcript_23607:566-1072(-)
MRAWSARTVSSSSASRVEVEATRRAANIFAASTDVHSAGGGGVVAAVGEPAELCVSEGGGISSASTGGSGPQSAPASGSMVWGRGAPASGPNAARERLGGRLPARRRPAAAEAGRPGARLLVDRRRGFGDGRRRAVCLCSRVAALMLLLLPRAAAPVDVQTGRPFARA